MNWDDIIYISLLGFSILFGLVYVKLNTSFQKQWAGTVLGFILIYFVSGFHILHPLFIVAVNICIIRYTDKSKCHIISFCFSFSYLLFFRLCAYLGIPEPPAHTNAVHMIMTLKMVGLAFEVHDTWKLKTEFKQTKQLLDSLLSSSKSSESKPSQGILEENTLKKRNIKGEDKESNEEKNETKETIDKFEELQLRLQYEDIHPSILETIHYAFNYCGILTGPYYRYKVFNDMISTSVDDRIVTWHYCLQRLKWLPVYAILFLLTSKFFPLSFATTDAIFKDYSLGYRLLYMHPVFYCFKMRLYSGFVLSECVCIMAGLGLYHVDSRPRPGKGPTDYKTLQCREQENSSPTESDYSFETVHNIDEYGTEASCTVREALRCWNMTVQYWLATNVYKRVNAPKPVKEALTMLTSAFWHGVHSGYYLSMLTVPFILVVEDFYARLLRRKLSEWGAKQYDRVTWFFKTNWFAYMGMGFLLLRINTTVDYWSSIGFLGHGVIIILHSLAQFINLIRGKAKKKVEKCRDTAFGADTRLRVKSIPELENRLKGE